MPRLSRLAVASSAVEPEALADLLEQPSAARLASLSVWDTMAGEDFWEALAQSENVRSLRRLNADDSDLTDELALALSRSRHLAIEELDMFYTPLGVAAACALLSAQPRLSLRCDVRSAALHQRLRLRAFGKRFTPGRRHDCGTPTWIFGQHFRMDRY
ncbi:MAG TPA: hypothetical protein VEQ58_05480 [Polyangiaceae bacterium]|nr:hypothetical protein [Polyangiaceae bacterium]